MLSDIFGVLQMQTYVNKGELLPDEIVSKVYTTYSSHLYAHQLARSFAEHVSHDTFPCLGHLDKIEMPAGACSLDLCIAAAISAY